MSAKHYKAGQEREGHPGSWDTQEGEGHPEWPRKCPGEKLSALYLRPLLPPTLIPAPGV